MVTLHPSHDVLTYHHHELSSRKPQRTTASISVKVLNRINEWWQQLDKRQQQPTMHTVITDEQHTCANCGTSFVGRFCPQCGLQANRHRMTGKNVAQGFLDIWGMGSRPMLRSIHELFWRPGYMIRDYLNGHQPLYFPPFKMLIIITLFFAFLCSLRGVEPSAEDAFVYGDVFIRHGNTPWVISLFARIDKVLIWLHTHPAYSAITAGIFYMSVRCGCSSRVAKPTTTCRPLPFRCSSASPCCATTMPSSTTCVSGLPYGARCSPSR